MKIQNQSSIDNYYWRFLALI